jgi:hypothetical protein
MEEKDTKRLHIPDVPATFYWQIKQAAAEERITLKKWVMDALEIHLKRIGTK